MAGAGESSYLPGRMIATGGRDHPAAPWLWWTTLALSATVAHVLIDVHIGLWGDTSEEMTTLQASNTFVQAALYGWWLLVVLHASRGDQWAMRSVLVFVAIYAFLLHGLVAFIAAPPPSAAFPYQDIAHGLSLVFGAVATMSVWRTIPHAKVTGRRFLFVGTMVLLVLGQAASALTFFQSARGF